MAHPFDPSQLVSEILSTIGKIINDDIRHHVQFAERQTKSLAKQAAWIAEAVIKNELSDEERDWFLSDLAALSTNFVRTVVALTILTIEKAWNAIVGIIWKTLNMAVKSSLGFELSVPAAPNA